MRAMMKTGASPQIGANQVDLALKSGSHLFSGPVWIVTCSPGRRESVHGGFGKNVPVFHAPGNK